MFATEGALKADAAHFLSGRTFAATAGAGNVEPFREPFAILKANGTKSIYEAHDMDKYTNVHVRAGALKLHHLIAQMGFQTKVMNWNENYKGVDNFLLSKRRNEG